jgi:hypothetical protein
MLAAQKAPAMPPPTGIREALICGLGGSSLMPLLLAQSYHNKE